MGRGVRVGWAVWVARGEGVRKGVADEDGEGVTRGVAVSGVACCVDGVAEGSAVGGGGCVAWDDGRAPEGVRFERKTSVTTCGQPAVGA